MTFTPLRISQYSECFRQVFIDPISIGSGFSCALPEPAFSGLCCGLLGVAKKLVVALLNPISIAILLCELNERPRCASISHLFGPEDRSLKRGFTKLRIAISGGELIHRLGLASFSGEGHVLPKIWDVAGSTITIPVAEGKLKAKFIESVPDGLLHPLKRLTAIGLDSVTVSIGCHDFVDRVIDSNDGGIANERKPTHSIAF